MAKKRKTASARSRASGPVRLTAAQRVVVLFGKEAHLRTLYSEQLRSALGSDRGEVETIYFPGASSAVADVLDECRSFGLMGQHKLVIVDEAEKFVSAQTRPALERYAASPVEGATLLLRADTWRAGNLDKAIAKVGVVVKCDTLSVGQAAAWTQRRSEKHHGATIEPRAVEALIDRVGRNLGRLDAELAKLAAMSLGEPITADLVRQSVGMTREEEVWVIQSRLIGGGQAGAESAIRAVRDALGPSKQPPALVSFAMIDLARKLHSAAHLLHAGTPDMQVARQVKIWGEGQRSILAAARKARPDRLAHLLDAAIEIDAKSKTGRTSPALALETLAVSFASL